MLNKKIQVLSTSKNIFEVLLNKKNFFKDFDFYFSDLEKNQDFTLDESNINLIFVPKNYNLVKCKNLSKKIKNYNFKNYILCVDRNMRTIFSDVKESLIFLPLSFSELDNQLNKLKLSIPVLFKDLKLNKQNNSLSNTENNLQTSLTLIEANILDVLIKSKQSIKKSEINKLALGYSEKVDSHSLNSHIYRLRKKILEISSKVKIKSTNDFSYKII